jgi:hypothetical protein
MLGNPYLSDYQKVAKDAGGVPIIEPNTLDAAEFRLEPPPVGAAETTAGLIVSSGTSGRNDEP